MQGADDERRYDVHHGTAEESEKSGNLQGRQQLVLEGAERKVLLRVHDGRGIVGAAASPTGAPGKGYR